MKHKSRKPAPTPAVAEPQAGKIGSAKRRGIALEAIWQMAYLFDALAERGRLLDEVDTLEASAVIKALALRGKALTSAAMTALGDDFAVVSIEALERTVSHG
jgi:hypothetical protein